MLRMLQIATLALGVAFFLALAGVAYYSSKPPEPDQQQAATQSKNEQAHVEKHTLSGFINFLFPDAISIFTFWLVIATVLLGILAYMQIGFLGRAEVIAARNADAAKDAADVARDAVKLSDKTAERQLRAYVFVKEAFIRNLDGPDPPTVHIYVKNWGQTPAYNYTNAGAVKYGPFPNLDFSRDPKGDQRVAITTIPPSGDSGMVVNLPFVVTPEIKSLLKAGKCAIWAFGRIEYDDAFKKHRTQDFRFMFGGDAGTFMFERDGVRLGAMVQTTEGNSSPNED